MLGKKKCGKCNSKIDKDFDFCPYCGNYIEDNEDFGLLGKNDFTPSKPQMKLPLGFDLLFRTLVKELDKQFKELDKEIGKEKMKPNKLQRAGGISISISSSGNQPPKVMVNSYGNVPEFKQKEQEIKKQIKQPTNFSEENLKKLSTLQKTEPTTNIRRLSNRLIYEVDMPEVKSIKDISIIQLENSIEIKAIGKGKAYFKLIPLGLPIKKQKFEKGKLLLELENKD
jgi:hypothetical protein